MQNQASSDKILFLLKTRGAMTAKALASEMAMTPMGARQHLLQMQNDGLVEHYHKAEKVGRPNQYWVLTAQAQSRFPDSHSQLTLSMINAVQSVFGDEGLDKLIAQRESDSLKDYLAHMSEKTSLLEKIQALVQIRNEEGYMASLESAQDGMYWLHENHCAICAAASTCQSFCRSELALFDACLDGMASITREEHILNGARRCSYKIIAK